MDLFALLVILDVIVRLGGFSKFLDLDCVENQNIENCFGGSFWVINIVLGIFVKDEPGHFGFTKTLLITRKCQF